MGQAGDNRAPAGSDLMFLASWWQPPSLCRPGERMRAGVLGAPGLPSGPRPSLGDLSGSLSFGCVYVFEKQSDKERERDRRGRGEGKTGAFHPMVHSPLG